MGYSDDLRRMGASMWETEQNHPFVTGIGDGSLPLENFRHYMRQDYIFLIEYCRAISLAVAKAPTVEDMGCTSVSALISASQKKSCWQLNHRRPPLDTPTI